MMLFTSFFYTGVIIQLVADGQWQRKSALQLFSPQDTANGSLVSSQSSNGPCWEVIDISGE